MTTAKDDLDSAVILRKSGKFAHSCFHAQQAGEKAVKAFWYFADADPWGHSVLRLIDDLESVDLKIHERLKSLFRLGMVLDRFYIPTRYPNGLPDITPDAPDEDADTCIEHAGKIIDAVHLILTP